MTINHDQQDQLPKADFHNEIGIQLAERGWVEEAIKEFKKAIKILPTSSISHDNLGNVYAQKGDLLNALSSYTKALNLDPDNPFALHNLGCFLSNYGHKLASQCFKNAIKLEPDFFESHYHLGLCLKAEMKYDEAVLEFNRALNDCPEDNDIRLELALSYIELEKEKLAVKELLQILKNDDKNADAWYYLAHCFNKKGFIKEAFTAISKSLNLNSINVEAILLSASIQMRLGYKKDARLLVKKALKIDPKFAKSFIEADEYLSL